MPLTTTIGYLWCHHPVTKFSRDCIRSDRNELISNYIACAWLNENFPSSNGVITAPRSLHNFALPTKLDATFPSKLRSHVLRSHVRSNCNSTGTDTAVYWRQNFQRRCLHTNFAALGMWIKKRKLAYSDAGGRDSPKLLRRNFYWPLKYSRLCNVTISSSEERCACQSTRNGTQISSLAWNEQGYWTCKLHEGFARNRNQFRWQWLSTGKCSSRGCMLFPGIPNSAAFPENFAKQKSTSKGNNKGLYLH